MLGSQRTVQSRLNGRPAVQGSKSMGSLSKEIQYAIMERHYNQDTHDTLNH